MSAGCVTGSSGEVSCASCGPGWLLVVGAVPSRAEAAAALVVFAGATMVSMAALSTGFGRVLGRAATTRGAQRLFPALGTLSLAFGAWYTALAL